ncbi:MAG TPA: two-component sensor histidine kinase, partial [Agrobacterium sp.]|nr:two-component sensor histidine kinase [Agrobacterium sp.]
PGIPEAERDKVFRRLYRLDKSRSTPGSGLGLSLVRAIADLHGVDITLADNQPGLVVSLSMARANSKI